jgi:hypothetical protein
VDRYRGSTPVAFPADRQESARIDSMGQFIQELTSGIADAADADQWAVAVPGVEDTGSPALPDLIPRWWLDALDAGRAATHRITLPLRSGRRYLGVVRLESWKPGGFRGEEMLGARRAVRSAARLLDMMMPEPDRRSVALTHMVPARLQIISESGL